MKLAYYILIAAIFLSGCTQPNDARRILSQNGYTDIQMTGYDWFGCGNDDSYADAFTAKSPNGSQVEGVVCAGLLSKGATIRLY